MVPNIDCIAVLTRAPTLNKELVNKKYPHNTILNRTILRFIQLLENYLKLSVKYFVFHFEKPKKATNNKRSKFSGIFL